MTKPMNVNIVHVCFSRELCSRYIRKDLHCKSNDRFLYDRYTDPKIVNAFIRRLATLGLLFLLISLKITKNLELYLQ